MHNDLGSALYLQARVKEAIDHFAEAVRLDPNFNDANNNLRAAQAGPPLTKSKPPRALRPVNDGADALLLA